MSADQELPGVLLMKSIDYGRMEEILVQRASSPDEFTRWTAITWVARETNEELLAIKVHPYEGFDVRAIISIVKRQLSSEYEATRIESLHWISILLNTEVLSFLNDIFDTLLKALSDPSDQVVLLVLEVQACIAKDQYNFRHLVVFLLQNIRKNGILLEKRGALIIRRLCVRLEAERVYKELSTILEGESYLNFASTMQSWFQLGIGSRNFRS